MKFSSSVIRELKYYVYIYSHPITSEIFYVGKGKGNRVFSHLKDDNDNQKVKYINDLKRQVLKPKIEILIHGLEDENTALRVEASIIDLLDIHNLTNKQSGWKSATFGRMTIEQVISTYEKRRIDIIEPSILIRISQLFRYSMTETELYDFTRGYWKLNPDKAGLAKYAFSIYEGVIQEVYIIHSWFKAGTTFGTQRENKKSEKITESRLSDRYEFIGNFAEEEIRKKYKYKSVAHYFKKGGMNPIMYLNID